MSQPILSKSKMNAHPKKITDLTSKGHPKKDPNLFFLGLAGAALLGSTLLALSHNGKKKMLGHFIGLLVPSLLTLGLYNKTAHEQNDNILNVVKH